MPRMFVKVNDKKLKKSYVFEWSTISDEPNSPAVEEKDFRSFYEDVRGDCDFNSTKEELEKNYQEDLNRLNETGVSNPFYTLDDLMECSDEFTTKKKLIQYCRENLISY